MNHSTKGDSIPLRARADESFPVLKELALPELARRWQAFSGAS
jgi:hypothetical protein